MGQMIVDRIADCDYLRVGSLELIKIWGAYYRFDEVMHGITYHPWLGTTQKPEGDQYLIVMLAEQRVDEYKQYLTNKIRERQLKEEAKC